MKPGTFRTTCSCGRCCEKLCDRVLHLIAARLATMQFTNGGGRNAPITPQQIERRPVSIVECLPVGEVVIEHHCVRNAEPLDRRAYLLRLPFMRELGSMHTHD